MRDLFAEGALSSAFVPSFIRTMNQSGRDEAWLLASRVINTLLVVLSAATLLIYICADWFVYLLAADFSAIPGKTELTVQLTRIMSPFLMTIAVAAVFMGILNGCGRFFIPALAPSAFNVASILAGVFLSPEMERFGLAPIVSMAIGALLGGLGQLLVQVPAASRLGFRYRPAVGFRDPGVRRIAGLMLPAVFGLSATQINIVVDSQLAAGFGNGPVSYLNYAFRLMQLPIGLFAAAIATTTLAAVSWQAASENLARLQETVGGSLRLAACLTFPATVGLVLFRYEIIELVYQRGRFTPEDTLQTSRVLLFYGLALFAYSAIKILVPTFYALNDTRTPVRLSVTAIAAKIGLNFALIAPAGFLGLAMATAAATWLNFVLLAMRFVKRMGGSVCSRGLWIYGRIALASLVMGGIALVVHAGIQQVVPFPGTPGRALALLGAIAAGMGAILPLLRLFRVEEERALTGMVFRFASRWL
jgi:putative peptidoglycan lipid II flippase